MCKFSDMELELPFDSSGRGAVCESDGEYGSLLIHSLLYIRSIYMNFFQFFFGKHFQILYAGSEYLIHMYIIGLFPPNGVRWKSNTNFFWCVGWGCGESDLCDWERAFSFAQGNQYFWQIQINSIYLVFSEKLPCTFLGQPNPDSGGEPVTEASDQYMAYLCTHNGGLRFPGC